MIGVAKHCYVMSPCGYTVLLKVASFGSIFCVNVNMYFSLFAIDFELAFYSYFFFY